MSQDIINLISSSNNSNWQQSVSFYDEWVSGKSHFELATSGSTGSPKIINVTRAQMLISAQQTITSLGLKQADKLLVCINTAFIGGKMMLVRGLVGDMQINVCEPTSNPLKDIAQQFDFMAVVPLQLQTMINEGEEEKLNAMKCIIVGGAPISYELRQKIEELAVPVYATYGMTETVSHIALQQLNGSNKTNYFETLGDVVIVTDKRECLVIRGSVTANKKIITNDVVRIIDERKFEWLGRSDSIINSGGIKIQPELIEKQIEIIFSQLKINRRYFIYGIKDNLLGEKVALIIEGVEFDISQLNSALKNELKKFHLPKNILFVKKFTETATGKIKRAEIIQKL